MHRLWSRVEQQIGMSKYPLCSRSLLKCLQQNPHHAVVLSFDSVLANPAVGTCTLTALCQLTAGLEHPHALWIVRVI